MVLKITAIVAALALMLCLVLRLLTWAIFTFELLDFMEFQWLFRSLNLIDILLSTIPLILFFTLFFFTRPTEAASKTAS